MLNIGMTELLCFAIIALLVLGPEKLPEAARFAAKWYGKAKRFISSVQNEIDQELRLSEFRAEVQKEIERMTELEKRMQQQIDALRTPAQQNSAEAKKDKRLEYRYSEDLLIIPFSSMHIQKYGPAPLRRTAAAAPAKLKIAV